jgi:hypothetical protein
MPKKIEIIGQKFGKLTAQSEFTKNKHTYVISICDCGKQHSTEKYHLMKGHIDRCRSCQMTGKLRGSKHNKWTGCGEISGNWWYNHVVRSALADKSVAKNRKPKELSITVEYAWNLFLQQERKCALTGIEIQFPTNCYNDRKSDYTASLDRIDSSKGYIEGNVQWVHKHINMMKGKYEVEYFVEMCSKVTAFAGGKCEIS